MDEDTIQNESENYFESYCDLHVHELMLKDNVRNKAYKDTISANKDYIKDKIVLDVGCGTGILSIFCAQFGAKKVYAVEASNMANIAEEVIEENDLEDIIEVKHGRMEDVELNQKVDVIISEWMGAYLLHEGMLDSVIFARDKYLKPGGLLIPYRAILYVAPCSLSSLFDFWNNVSGISMRTVGKIRRAQKSAEPELCTLKPDDIIVSTYEPPVLDINLLEVKLEELECMERDFLMVASSENLFQGICLWFDVKFRNLSNETNDLCLSTSPFSEPTHWKQTVIILPVDIPVELGSPIAFKLRLSRYMENIRRYNIELEILDPNDVEHPDSCTCFMTKCILSKTCMEQQQTSVGN